MSSAGARPARSSPAMVCIGVVTWVEEVFVAYGQDWWTLGFEATGPADLLRSELQATAALMFAQALPGGVEPGPDESSSYAQWLGQLPAAEG